MLRTIQDRLNLLFIAFGLLVLVSVGAMIWGLETQRQDALLINLAGRQRMLAQQMGRLAFESGEGQERTNAVLQEVTQTFDQTLHALLFGGTAPYYSDTDVILPATRNAEIRSALDQTMLTWDGMLPLIDDLQSLPRENPAFEITLQSVEEIASTLVQQADVVVRLYEADATARVNQLRIMQTVFLACALVLLAAGALITRQSVLKPLNKLVHAAVRLGENDLDTPVQIEKLKEIRLLSEAFDSMRQNLRFSRQELVQLNENLEERVIQRTRELETLNEVSREISSRLDIQQVLDSVTEKARVLVEGEVASLCLLGEDHNWLKLQAVSGEKNSVSRQAVRVESGWTETVLESQQALMFGKNVCQGACLMLSEQCRVSHLAAPLRIGDKVIGALCVGSSVKNRFRDESVNMLTQLANVAAIALENARLYSQAERVATLEERNRIAAEMHDGIGQTLSYLSLMTEQIMGLLPNDQAPEAIERLIHTRKTIDQATLDIRHAINQLMDEAMVSRDLCISLEEAVKNYGIEQQLPVEWCNYLTSTPNCSSEVSEQVTKIVIEALTNVSRHAEAKRVVVSLEKNENELKLTVSDDGRGFIVPVVEQNKHFGLQVMEVRAAHIQGKVSVESEPGLGTKITLTWPEERLY